jgi:hypothetical protein
VQVLGLGATATPGILQPGESGRIAVYHVGMQDGNFVSNVTFTLGVLTADDTTPIDWTALNNELKPEWLSADAWTAIGGNLAAQVGSTWGGYVRTLAENANYLHSVGQDVTDVSTLWSFEIAQATAALSPYGALAGATDAYSRAPGMSLVFSRVYGQSIEARYEIGPLGRGWGHNWDLRVEVLSDGNVILRGPGGATASSPRTRVARTSLRRATMPRWPSRPARSA